MKWTIHLLVIIFLALALVMPFIGNVKAKNPNDVSTNLADGKYFDINISTSYIQASDNTKTKATGYYIVKNGQVSYEYKALIDTIPALADGLPINCSWTLKNGIYTTGQNLLKATVNRASVTVFKNAEYLSWNPILLIGGNEYLPLDTNPRLISVDPNNGNYQNNTLEWDYGVCVRRLSVTEGRISEAWVFSKKPSGNIQIQERKSQSTGFVWDLPPCATDALGISIPISVDKMVKLSDLQTATFPIVIDPTTEDYISSASDGWIINSSVTYNTAWTSSTGTVNATGPYFTIGQWKVALSYIYRGFVYFNTSALPDHIVISSANVSLYGQSDKSAKDFLITLQTGMPTYPQSPLVSTDYNKGFYSGDGGSYNTSGFITSGYNNISMNPTGVSWINVTDWTKFCLRSNLDIAGTAPAAHEDVNVWSYDKGAGYQPYLEVIYTLSPQYELTTASSAYGNISDPGESGPYTYWENEIVNIVATADNCCHFVNWTGDTATITDVNASSTTINMSANYSITANFAPDSYTLTYSAGDNGSINGSSPQIVDCGNDSTPVEAIPDLCYHFVNWSDSSTDNPRTDLNVSANLSVIANFAIDTYTLTYNAGAHGSISGDISQVVNCGDDGSTVTAVPSSCAHFVNWSDSSTDNPRTDLNVSANILVTANFDVNTVTQVVTFNSTPTGGNWTVPYGVTSVWVLVVGGGGGGGFCGGGGAGGYRENIFYPVTSGTNITVVVGDGGISGNQGGNGSDSVFGAITSTGGGGGGGLDYPPIGNGLDGGSGGGAGATFWGGVIGLGNIPATTPTQGFDGGNSFTTGDGAGGGGGASEVGQDDQAGEIGGKGGDGVASAISGFTVDYAGGGGGYGYYGGGIGGLGGGGLGGTGEDIFGYPVAGDSGLTNTGGGGGGTYGLSSNDGGSGVVIINYTYYANFDLAVSPNIVDGGTPSFNGSSPFDCDEVVNIYANTNFGYIFTGWAPVGEVLNSSAENTSVVMNQSHTLVANYIKGILYPPTNLNATINGTMCLNMLWTMGMNTSTTILIACRDTVHNCSDTDFGNLSDGCWVLYNGSGTSLATDSCGLDLDLFEYHITAYGGDGRGNYSTTCGSLTVGGATMIAVLYTGIAAIVALGLVFIAFWQKKLWLFMVAGLDWFGLGIFGLTQNPVNSLNWILGWVFLMLCIMCLLAMFWFREKKEDLEVDEDTERHENLKKQLEDIRKRRNSW